MKDLVSTVTALAANLSERERQLLRAALAPAPEPLAIVGIGCRFPGGGDDPDGFWRLLDRGGDAVREVPADRWDLAEYFDPDPEAAGRMSTRHGAFLDHVDRFDPGFFEISPTEARRMDPQQRLLLEVAHEALLDAGLPIEDLRGAAAGVFIGACNHDYDSLQPAPADAHTLTGGLMSVLSGRLSHVLGLRGPSLTIDTACSSSLVALHLACTSLRARETELALVGGVNLILAPEAHVRLSRMRALAPDGRCRTFDARASGYVRGEGVGVLVLKRLADARRDADKIWAVVRGTAVNHDGRSTSLTAPNGLSQREVIARALADARVRADAIDYIEAHGTGTPLGDPIEVESLHDLFSGARPCVLGSVKTNIGHLEAAAGVAGVIKVALSLTHERIPRHLHFHEQNPRITLGSLEVASQARPWPRGDRERLAGVSSFGISGTNAHVVLAEAPREHAEPLPARSGPREPAEPLPARSGPLVLPLSAHSPAALAQLARSWSAHLRSSDVPLADLLHTAATRRDHLAHRLAVTGTSAEALAQALDGFDFTAAPTGDDLPAQYMRGATIAWSSLYPGRRPPAALPRHPWQHERLWAPSAPPTTSPTTSSPTTTSSTTTPSPTTTSPTTTTSSTTPSPTTTSSPITTSPTTSSTTRSPTTTSSPITPSPTTTSSTTPSPLAPGRHALLGEGIDLAAVPGLQCWRAVLDLADHPWLADHRLADTPVLPAAAILDAALWASGRALERVTFDRLVELRGPRELQLVLHPDSRFELLGREPRGAWQPHAAGTLGEPLPLPDRLDLTALRARLAPLDLATLQTTITAVGLEHGPAFASITAVCSSDGEALAELRLPPGLSSAGHSIHPALLDGCLQAIAAATRGAGLPVEIQHIHLARSPGAGLCCHVRTRPEGDFILADLTLTDPDGQPLGQLHALRVRRLAEPAPAHDPHEPAPVLRDRSALESEVTAATREVLGFAADLRIPAAQDLRDLGLDSLLALDLATAIGRRLGRTLVNSFALDYPTIAAMTDALAGASEAP